MYYSTKRIDLQISFIAAMWLRVAQVFGLAFLFVPISLASYTGIPPEKNNSVAGIINFMRNIGSSVGTSMVTTLLARRGQLHQLRLVEYARPDNPNFQSALNGLTEQAGRSGLSPPDAKAQALARIYQQVQAQSQSLAYIDIFMVLAVAAAIMIFLSFTLEKNALGGGAVHVE